MKKCALYLLALAFLPLACTKKSASVVPPIPVSVMEVSTASDTTIRHYVGTIESDTKVDLTFRLGGTLTELNVRNGELVRAGQRIAAVDDTRARALHEAALATLRQAEDAYTRMERVYKEGGISDVRWMQMLTDLEKARQSEISTRQNVEDCYMVAPVTGVVEVRNISVGSHVAPVEKFATIQDLRAMNVRFTIPEQEIGRIGVGDAVELSLPALEYAERRAIINERSLVSNPMGHTYTVRASLQDGRDVLPGMVAKVRMHKTGNVGVVIPSSCILTVYDGYVVWAVKDSMVHRQHVVCSDLVRNGVLVTEGLQDGDIVVVDGCQKLYPGAKVSY